MQLNFFSGRKLFKMMTKIINKKMKEKIQFTIIILHSSFDSKQLLKNLGGGSDLYLFLSLSESLAKISE